MGHTVHHTIVVSTYDDKRINKAHEEARELGNNVTNIMESKINTYFTFCVVPDGSKSGWGESDRGDEAREAFKTWLGEQAFEDGSNAFSWVEVEFGDDITSIPAKVIDDSNRQCARDPRSIKSGII